MQLLPRTCCGAIGETGEGGEEGDTTALVWGREEDGLLLESLERELGAI